MKVLIVDDNKQNLLLLEAMLKGGGHEAVRARNGIEALEILGREKVDMIISDILMPGMDGFILCMKCKEDEKLRAIPFIYVTSSYTEAKDEEFGKSLGAEAFIVRPIEPEEFLKNINEIFGNKNEKKEFAPAILKEKDVRFLEKYSERLARKLEHKVLDLQKEITERKRAEEMLLESEDRYRTFFNTSRDSVFITSVDGNWIDMNDAAFELFGYSSREELTHVKIPNLYANAEDRARHIKIIVQRGYTKDYPVDLRKKDGVVIHTLITSGARHDADGHVIEFMGTIKDITERKRAEEELKKSEGKFRAIFDNASDGMFIVDLKDRKFFMCNAKCAKMLGYTQEEFSTLDIADIHPREDLPFVNEQIGKFSRGEEGLRSDIRFKRKDGSNFVADLRPALLTIAEKKYLLINFNDVTERKRAEEELQFRNVILSTQQEASIDGILVVDEDANIVSYNQRFVDMWGVPLELVEKKADEPVLEFVTNKTADPRSFLQRVQYLYEHKRETSQDEIVLKNGLIFDRYSAPMVGSDDRYYGRVWYFGDITERRRAEEELRQREEKYRSIFENVQDAYYETLIDGTILEVSPSIENMSKGQYHRNELIGKSMYDFYSDVDERQTFISALRKGGSVTDFEVTLKNGDGSSIPCSVSSKIQFNAQGNPEKIIGSMRDITKRKRAEEELKKSEEKYRDLIDNMNEGIFIADEQMVITFANKALANIHGYDSTDKMLNRYFTEFIEPSMRDEMGQNIKKEMQSGELPALQVIPVIKADGSLAYVQVRPSTIYKGKQIVGTMGIVQDITERKRAEEELKKSEAKYRDVFMWAPVGIYQSSIDGKIITANKTLADMLGYDLVEDLINRDMAKDVFCNEKERQRLVEQYDTEGEGSIVDADILWKKKDGTPIWIMLTAHAVRDGSNKTAYYEGFVRDITERRQSEENIRMLSGALEQSPASVVITDLEGKIEYVNPKFTEITGYTFQEALGQNPRILKSGDKPAEEYKRLWETITSDEEWRGEFHNKKKNGELYWESASISPIKDASGKITRYLAVKEDITEQKSLQTQLMRAQRMESIGTLASGVAHDLNNVLTPIMLGIEILGKAMPDEQSQKMLEVLATSAHRGSDIVKQILGFARGAEGENVLIQVRHIINEMTNIIKETFPKSITIKADVPKKIWTIVGDPTNLQQLMLNLCVNARDAMPDGGTIRIKAENKIIDEHYATMSLDAKPGRYLMLSIEDAGCGMPPVVLEHIFEPFFTTKEVGRGTGLGLSTVHGIVKSHGGFINVHSEVGKGTTFKIYLPAAEETSEIKPSSEELPEMFLGHGELIMVVDDESSIQQITRQTLETYGYRVITASNGAEAIAHYASSKEEVALVLIDMIMPYMDGPMTIRALQRMKASAKIVGTSGDSGRDGAVMASIPGVHAFLKKPYTAEKLLKTMHDVLNEE